MNDDDVRVGGCAPGAYGCADDYCNECWRALMIWLGWDEWA